MFMVQGKDFTNKTISIDDAIDKICDERRERKDLQRPISAMHLGLDTTGQHITVTIDGVDFKPTMHCLKQMATWCGVSHSVLKQYLNPVLNQNGTVKYERDQTDRELLVALFKNGIRDKRIDPDKEFRFRTYTDGTLRAMVSDRYAVIDNVWYLEQIKNIMGDEPRFIHWRGDADTIFGSLLLPDTLRDDTDSGYGGMFSVSNCEIGKRRLGLTPSIFRSICTNGMIFGQERGIRFSQVHRGNIDLVTLRERMRNHVDDQLPYITANIDTFLNMKQLGLTAKPSAVIAQIAQDHKLTTGAKGQAVEVVKQFVDYESNDRNLFGIVNAITRAAQLYTPDEQVRLEGIGGSFMFYNKTQWDKYNVRANSMNNKQRNKIFGIVA